MFTSCWFPVAITFSIYVGGGDVMIVLSGSEDVAVYPGRTDVDARLKITWKACV
jgi:hypothetical protein